MQQAYNSPYEHPTKAEQKVWKIGTYSMGLTLIGIGLSFAVSLWQETTAYELLLWLAPIVFIVLGLELLIVHNTRFLTQYKLQYNWIAVWFVGFVGAGALMLAAFLSSGLLEEVNQMFKVKERSVYIEERAQLPEQSIEKIVVKSELGYTIEKQAQLKEVSLLGTVQYESEQPIKLADQQLLKISQVGHVLYVFIQGIEYDSNVFTSSYVRSQLVLNVPDHIEVIS